MGSTFVLGCAVESCGAAGGVVLLSWANAHAAITSTQSRLNIFFMDSLQKLADFRLKHSVQQGGVCVSVNPFTSANQGGSASSGITDSALSISAKQFLAFSACLLMSHPWFPDRRTAQRRIAAPSWRQKTQTDKRRRTPQAPGTPEKSIRS